MKAILLAYVLSLLLCLAGCVSQAEQRASAEMQQKREQNRQIAAREASQIVTRVKDYVVYFTKYDQYEKDKQEGAWRVLSSGVAREWDSSGTIACNRMETVGTLSGPVCNLVFTDSAPKHEDLCPSGEPASGDQNPYKNFFLKSIEFK